MLPRLASYSPASSPNSHCHEWVARTGTGCRDTISARNRRASETGPMNFYAAYSYANQDQLTQVDGRNTNASCNLIT